MDTLSSLTGNKIALLIDFDNVILGVEDPGFDIELVVNAMRSRGIVVMGRAYGDWYRHHRHRRKLMEQGIELVETPVFGPLIKNSADIRIVLDGFEIAMSQPHIDTFCLVSGDSDFLPLIKKLQYLGKSVIVIAGIKFTSDLIRRNCNEYLAYENLFAESLGATEDVSQIDGAFHLLARSIETLNERGMDVRSSSVKQMMRQLNPAFSERTFGCSQFKQFLERASKAAVVRLEVRNGGAGEASVYLLEEAKEAMRETAAQLAPLPTITRESTRAEVRAVAREATTRESASRESSRDLASRETAAQNGIQNGAPRETERPSERRDLSTARRSGRKFSGRAGRVETVSETVGNAEAANVDAALETPALDVAIAPLEAISNDGAAAPAGGFINVLAQRTDLRRGRLRFSARSGVARQEAKPSTVEFDRTQSEDATPKIDESLQQTTDRPVEEAETKKRPARRGGRGRKKKDEAAAPEEIAATENAVAEITTLDVIESESEVVAPDAAESVLTEDQTAATAETVPAESIPAEMVSEEAAPAPRAKRLRTKKPRATKAETPEDAVSEVVATEIVAPETVLAEAVAPEVAAEEAAPETEAVEKKPRSRRGGVKRTAARKKKDEGETESA